MKQPKKTQRQEPASAAQSIVTEETDNAGVERDTARPNPTPEVLPERTGKTNMKFVFLWFALPMILMIILAFLLKD